MEIVDLLLANRCDFCRDVNLRNADHIDIKWRDNVNGGVWPKPFQRGGIDPRRVRGVVIGQDPTIEDPRAIEYVLEADPKEAYVGVCRITSFILYP